MSGVFAVDRGVFDHPLFAPEPYTEREAWVWLCGAAAWKDTRVRVGRHMIGLKRGQCAFALRFLAAKWKWAEARVRRFLNRLKTDAMIVVAATREATQITICNYERYAFGRRTDDAQTDAQTDEPATRNRRKEEEGKKLKKEEEKEEASLRSGELALESVSRETISKAKRAKARTPLADDWLPSIADAEHALGLGFTREQIGAIAGGFKNHHLAKGNLMADWCAAWRTWCGNEIKFQRSNGNGQRSARQFQDDSKSVSRAAERLQERFEREGVTSFPPRPTLLPRESQSDLLLLPEGRGTGS